jgi:CheY-like chemotaxis protein
LIVSVPFFALCAERFPKVLHYYLCIYLASYFYSNKAMKAVHEIWLAEEDEDEVALWQEVLGELGNTRPVRVFDNGFDVITALRALPRNIRCLLFVSDRMPLMDGLDLVRLIYAECLLPRHRVVLLTGLLSPLQQEIISLFKIPNRQKPASYRELKRIFSEWLDRFIPHESSL